MASFINFIRHVLTPLRLTLAIALVALASNAYVVLGTPVDEALTGASTLLALAPVDTKPAVPSADTCSGPRDGAAAVPQMPAAAMFQLQPRQARTETFAQFECNPMPGRPRAARAR